MPVGRVWGAFPRVRGFFRSRFRAPRSRGGTLTCFRGKMLPRGMLLRGMRELSSREDIREDVGPGLRQRPARTDDSLGGLGQCLVDHHGVHRRQEGPELAHPLLAVFHAHAPLGKRAMCPFALDIRLQLRDETPEPPPQFPESVTARVFCGPCVQDAQRFEPFQARRGIGEDVHAGGVQPAGQEPVPHDGQFLTHSCCPGQTQRCLRGAPSQSTSDLIDHGSALGFRDLGRKEHALAVHDGPVAGLVCLDPGHLRIEVTQSCGEFGCLGTGAAPGQSGEPLTPVPRACVRTIVAARSTVIATRSTASGRGIMGHGVASPVRVRDSHRRERTVTGARFGRGTVTGACRRRGTITGACRREEIVIGTRPRVLGDACPCAACPCAADPVPRTAVPAESPVRVPPSLWRAVRSSVMTLTLAVGTDNAPCISTPPGRSAPNTLACDRA